MAEVKGKFITLCGRLMSLYKEKTEEADAYLKAHIGKSYNEIEPEEWIDAHYLDYLMSKYAEASFTKERAIIMLGRHVYPTIQRTVGLPPHLVTPLDFILFEAEGFLANHRGGDVIPRKFIKQEEGEVIVIAPAPGYSPKLFEGVFLGILDMCGVQNASVVMMEEDTFKITW